MIFVTVGSNLRFDRLVRAVDAWAERNPEVALFAQVGDTDAPPRHVEWTARLSPDEFRARVRAADLVVAHAGMGTILTALTLGRPLLVLARQAARGETRNDHQIATARVLAARGLVTAAADEEDLGHRLDTLAASSPAAPAIGPTAEPGLIATIRNFVLA